MTAPLPVCSAKLSIVGPGLTTKKSQRPKAPQRTRPAAKPWRYSSPKNSRWDVRHTKSFRFELLLKASGTLTLPMHKKPRESLSHVLGKGLLWALFQDRYGSNPTQTILVETPIPQEPRYVPDVVAFHHPKIIIPSAAQQQQQDDTALLHSFLEHDIQPSFWGESGRMSAEKAADLAHKYPNTHLVHLRWGSGDQNTHAGFFEEIETAILPSLHYRTAPFEFAFLAREPKSCVDEDGVVRITRDDVQWRTAGFGIDRNY
eukprot:Sro65_g036880.2  (259) ;mRNA; r:104705-105744